MLRNHKLIRLKCADTTYYVVPLSESNTATYVSLNGTYCTYMLPKKKKKMMMMLMTAISMVQLPT